jgi:hypothetical protein
MTDKEKIEARDLMITRLHAIIKNQDVELSLLRPLVKQMEENQNLMLRKEKLINVLKAS